MCPMRFNKFPLDRYDFGISWKVLFNELMIQKSRVIFMEDHIAVRPDISLLLGRHTSKWSLWDVVFLENDSS